MTHGITLTLTLDEAERILTAIDSHQYWQLCEPEDRSDGDHEPPTEDSERAEEYVRFAVLAERIGRCIAEAHAPRVAPSEKD